MKKIILVCIMFLFLGIYPCQGAQLNDMTAEQVIEALGLEPLTVEGGYFKSIYVSRESYLHKNLPKRFDGDRHYQSAIYFLITENSFSPFHKINNNEVWTFCAGDPAVQTTIDKEGHLKQITFGHDILQGQAIFNAIPAESWQSTRMHPGGKWALFALSTAPAFEYSDYTGAADAEILKKYPQHETALSHFFDLAVK